jgi:tetratricopeptide (TPR) repeat protein
VRHIQWFAILLAAGWLHAQQAADARQSSPLPPESGAALSVEQRADIFMARKMYREAIETYKSADLKSPIILNKIGIAHHQSSDLGTAKKYYERAIKARKDYSEAINNLGTVHYAQKSYRRAISQYKKALQIAPNSASIHSNLGTAHFARKQYELAAQEYETALRLDPEVFEHRSTQGVLLQERSVEERAKFHYYLAKTYAKAGMVELSLSYIRKSLEGGFREKKRFLEDAEFAEVRKHPDFEILMKLEPRVL